MKQHQVTLGHALALLKSEQNGNHRPDLNKLDAESQKYLEHLRAKVSSGNIHSEFPPKKNHSSDDLVTKLEDHFICCFLLETENGEQDCAKLYSGLNDSYLCFQEFVDVIRDYHLMSRKLGSN